MQSDSDTQSAEASSKKRQKALQKDSGLQASQPQGASAPKRRFDLNVQALTGQKPIAAALPSPAIADKKSAPDPVIVPAQNNASDSEFPLSVSTPAPAIAAQLTHSQPAAAENKANRQFTAGDYKPRWSGFNEVRRPEELAQELSQVGYQCLPFVATQLALLMNSPTDRIRAILLEGPSGCGKSYLAKSLAKVTNAELMCLSCYRGMPTQNLIESPSTLAMVNAMTGKASGENPNELMNLGILSRAYLRSQKQPVILLIDELDKPDGAIDTFFLGPIQDARIWLESRPPIDADPNQLIIMFTKNFNRVPDEALLRRVHPIKMTYLDSTLERKILAPHCHPQLVDNLVGVADRMRNSGGSYQFERPPAPEELLTAGTYVMRLLEWGKLDFGVIGKNIWAILAKSEHDRAVLEHMMRFHPDFMDPLCMDAKNAGVDEIYKRLGRVILQGLVNDPDANKRAAAWKDLENY